MELSFQDKNSGKLYSEKEFLALVSEVGLKIEIIKPEHFNVGLPPIGVNLLVKQGDSWVPCRRSSWSSSSTGNIDFVTSRDTFSIHSNNIKWKYA